MSEDHDTRIRELEIANERTVTVLEHVAEAVNGLNSTVQDLRDTMNKGKGALTGMLWLCGVMSAAVGGVISWVTTLFYRQP